MSYLLSNYFTRFDPQRKVARLPCSPLDTSRTRPSTYEKAQSNRLHIQHDFHFRLAAAPEETQ